MSPITAGPSEATDLDIADELSGFRKQFFLPPGKAGGEAIYFAGNSLGLQPFSVRSAVEAVLDDWSELAVSGWMGADPPWTRIEESLAHLAAPMVGASPDEVCVSGTLTGNLHALLTSFYRPDADRYRILVEHRPFPSDRYALAAHASWHGHPESAICEAHARPGTDLVDEDALVERIEREGSSIALVLLGAVNYYSGQRFDVTRIARAARAQGCVVGLDLAHAIGNVPVPLHDAEIDFAVWCSYKYLCGGPGAPGGFFVHRRHHDSFDGPRLAGWWGNRLDTRFRMEDRFDAAPGASGWLMSTPSVLGLAPLAASLALVRAAGLDRMRGKSVKMAGYLERLLSEHVADRVALISPADPAARGAQLSLGIQEDSRGVFERISAEGIVCDWREPNAIRVAPSPLYNTFSEIERFVQTLRKALDA